MPLSPGQLLLDRYRIDGRIAQGGMGAAFAFVLSTSAYFPYEARRREGGTVTDVPNIVGARSF